MKKHELLSAIATAVAEETEISVEIILSKTRREEVIDARYIVVKLLHDYGLYPRQIADLLSITARRINHILSDFEHRATTRKLLRNNYGLAGNKVSLNYIGRQSQYL